MLLPMNSRKCVSSSLRLVTVLTNLLLIFNFVPSTYQKNPSQQQQPRLIFANRKEIRILDFYSSGARSGTTRGNTTLIVKDLTDATALDIHYERGLVCWSDIEQEKIQCSPVDSHSQNKNHQDYYQDYESKESVSGITTIVSTALPAPEDLVCDFITSKLYWSDSETNRIEVVSMFPPHHRKVLIWEEIDQPRSLALAPNIAIMFWTDWGEYPKIEKAGMDGSDRRIIVEKEIYWPNGIALDLKAQLLYWVDAKLHYIASVNFDGDDRKVINQGAPLHPFALAYHSGYLFWSDWNTNSLHVIKTDGSQSKTIVTKQSLTPMDLTIFEEQTLPPAIWSGKVNPCNTSHCSHLCLLAPKAPYYTCACPIGIKLLPSSTTNCASEINSFLLVARGNDIRRISLDTPDYTDVILPLQGIKHILAVDYDVKSGFMFWTDDEAKRIKRAKMDGSEQQDVVKEEIVHPDGLAVDWVAGNLYWTDAGTDRIEVSRLNGRYRKILISRGLQEPRAVAVDPKRGLLFWSDWGGKKGKIEKSSLDGSSRTSVINTDIYWPNGIALDIQNSKIYWCDAHSDIIWMANYDGSSRRKLLIDDLPHTFGFSVLGDYVYWTDWQRRTVERANKFTGKDRMAIKDPFSDPMGLKAIDIQDPTLNITNGCAERNGGCQHLCLFRPTGVVCACASGYELEQDNHSCTIPDAFLVFSRDGDLHRISLNRTDNNNIDDVIPVSKVKAASAVDFDTVENRIYWSDTKIKAISRAFMNGSDTERVIEFGLLHPEGIAVDWLSRNIYWSDLGKSRIEVAKLNGDHRRTILWADNIDSPRSIALHPSKGLMYFAMWKLSNPSIEKAALDGSSQTAFISKNIGRANGLTIDITNLEESFLYWTDIDSMVIERASLDDGNKKREVIVAAEGGFKPFSLAQYQDYIYWSDITSHTIRRANKSASSTQSPHILASALNIIDMAIYHKFKQVGWNPCSQTNCSHLCFPTPGRVGKKSQNHTVTLTDAKCGCPTHYTLSKDKSTCVAPKEFLLLSSDSTISRLILDTTECPDAIVIGGPQQKSRSIGSLAWDGKERVIYWIDPKSANIKKAYENGTHGSYLLNSAEDVFKPFDLVFDNIRKLIFWSCENYNSINVTESSGRSLGSIISASTAISNANKDDYASSLRPRHLALHSEMSQLYFSNEGKIERIRLDGMQHTTIVSSRATVAGLALDLVEGMIYWTDTMSKKIDSCDLDGKNRKVLVPGLDSPGSIAVMGRYVYWIEERGGVERVEKFSGVPLLRTPIPRIDNINYILHVNDSNINETTHPCSSMQCSHICIDSGVCSCPEGWVRSSDDQRSCNYRLPCGAHEFSCHKGPIGCISFLKKCDGNMDCDDGSDEFDCPKKCDFQCPCETACETAICLSKANICDGHDDCIGNGWDESVEVCSASPHTTGSPSSITSVLTPIIVVLIAIIGATTFFCLRSKNTIPSEDSSDPLNPPGTNITTLHTLDNLNHFAPTNGTSSIGSSPYCGELLVPHPSPATEVRSYCCHGNYAMYNYEPAPPPTPCSTDVCDNSDIYAFAPPPSPHTSSPHSTIRSIGGLYPPPPSPNLT